MDLPAFLPAASFTPDDGGGSGDIDVDIDVDIDGAMDGITSGSVSVDGKLACGKCGRSFKPKADGTLRAHKCVEGVTTVSTRVGVPKRGKRKGAPQSVRRMGVALIGAGTETLASLSVATFVPMPRADIPEKVTTLPDADAMIGPIIDRLFPELPKSTQLLLQRLAEQEDLIAAMFLWVQWSKAIADYTRAAHDLVQEQKNATTRTTQNGVSNVVPISRETESGFEWSEGPVPFVPVPDGPPLA